MLTFAKGLMLTAHTFGRHLVWHECLMDIPCSPGTKVPRLDKTIVKGGFCAAMSISTIQSNMLILVPTFCF